MAKTQVIDMVDVRNPWNKLLLKFANSTNPIHVIECKDSDEARYVRDNLNHVRRSRETWFDVLFIVRKNNVYVVNLNGAQKVRLNYGK